MVIGSFLNTIAKVNVPAKGLYTVLEVNSSPTVLPVIAFMGTVWRAHTSVWLAVTRRGGFIGFSACEVRQILFIIYLEPYIYVS